MSALEALTRMSTGITEFVGEGPPTYEGNPSIMVRIDFTTCDGQCMREAAKLHAVGFRAGMTVDEACALFKAAREGK